MTIGLTKRELEARNNDSLIKYIGVLQTELQLHYEMGFQPQGEEIKKELDSSCSDTLKSTG